MIRIFATVLAALLGLAFGSFLNVCLSRWPVEESVVAPRSRCPQCSRTLAWLENIPILSWLALRGRCRTCHTWIGWRYPLVEAAVAVLWAIPVWQCFTAPPDPLDQVATPMLLGLALTVAVGNMILCWLLIALAGLDAENLWLPDWLTYPGILLGFISTLTRARLLDEMPGISPVRQPILAGALHCLLGIAAAAALILLIRWVYWLCRRREGVGLGDAKLMALLAAWLGLPGALLAFGLGVVLGALTALILLAIPRASEQPGAWAARKLPLGTFLCIGGVVSALWGQPIIAAYLRWAGF
jgi:leader peptidase (prepilin peptidase)/N-methyltransferase